MKFVWIILTTILLITIGLVVFYILDKPPVVEEHPPEIIQTPPQPKPTIPKISQEEIDEIKKNTQAKFKKEDDEEHEKKEDSVVQIPTFNISGMFHTDSATKFAAQKQPQKITDISSGGYFSRKNGFGTVTQSDSLHESLGDDSQGMLRRGRSGANSQFVKFEKRIPLAIKMMNQDERDAYELAFTAGRTDVQRSTSEAKEVLEKINDKNKKASKDTKQKK